MKSVLVIGGTGILGIPLIMQLIRNNEYKVYSIALNKAQNPSFSGSVEQYIVDRYSNVYESVIEGINLQVNYEFDAVIDLIAYDRKSAEQTYLLFKNSAKHIISISTTLVYDRGTEIKKPITEDIPLAAEGEYGGYVDGKLKLEKFWHNIKDINWTLLRLYHVLGKYSLLGCIPCHNRDPKLIDKIKNNKIIKLANGGNIFLNYIHPDDVATAVCKIINNKKTFKQVYNLVNPKSILAKDYYLEIGKQLNKKINIETISLVKLWKEKKGWEMTMLPHVYSIEKFKKDINFIPTISLSQAIKDAINYQSNYKTLVKKIPVHINMNKLPRPNKPKWLK